MPLGLLRGCPGCPSPRHRNALKIAERYHYFPSRQLLFTNGKFLQKSRFSVEISRKLGASTIFLPAGRSESAIGASHAPLDLSPLEKASKRQIALSGSTKLNHEKLLQWTMVHPV
jgi:hypothetical protein